MFSTVRETASLNSSPETTGSESWRLLKVNLVYDKPWLRQIRKKSCSTNRVYELTRKQTVEQSFDADNVYIPRQVNGFHQLWFKYQEF